MRKIVSIALCVVMVVLCIPNAYAGSEWQDTVSIDGFVSYVNSIIPDLAQLPDVTFPEDGVMVSQPYAIIDSDNNTNYIFFLFDGSTCIGEVSVSYSDGNFYSSFLSCELDAVSDVYTNSVPFYLLSDNDVIWLCTATSREIIVGNQRTEEYEESVAQSSNETITTNISYVPLTLSLVLITKVARSSGLPSSSATLDVPYVANYSLNGGLCWAAATASVVRYLRGNTTVDALSVYNTLVMEYGSAAGYSETVRRGLYLYGVSGYVASTSSISYQTAAQKIDAGYPVIMSMGIAPGDGTGCHFVVLCGYMSYSDGSDYIQILDSNVPDGKIWITFYRDTNTIRYVASTYTYTQWFETVYYSGT